MATDVVLWSIPAAALFAMSAMGAGDLMSLPQGPVIYCAFPVDPPPGRLIPVYPYRGPFEGMPKRRPRPLEQAAAASPHALPAAPLPTKRVAPVYPLDVLHPPPLVVVALAIVVEPDGRVGEVQIESTDPPGQTFERFGKAAQAAVQQWEFATAEPGRYQMTVKFSIE